MATFGELLRKREDLEARRVLCGCLRDLIADHLSEKCPENIKVYAWESAIQAMSKELELEWHACQQKLTAMLSETVDVSEDSCS